MTTRTWRAHGRALTLSTLFTLLPLAASEAAVLASFDFDSAAGGFEATPDSLHPALLAAAFTDDAGTLTDFAGVDGRAIAASAFASGNAIALTLTAAPGWRLTLDGLGFALRVSASGPTAWQLDAGDGPLASGAASTSFTVFDVALTGQAPTAQVTLSWTGTGASSASGTLRLDDVAVLGTISAVPVPGALALCALPAAGLLGSRRRAQGVKGHSRQPSTSGK